MVLASETNSPLTPVSAPVFRAGIGRRLPPGHIRVGPGIAIPAVLKDFGRNPNEVLLSAGVSPDSFSDPDNTLPLERYCALALKCARVLGRDDFGLLVCEKASASNLGLVGYLLLQAPDVRTALGDLVRYLHHSDRAAVPFMSVMDGVVLLGYSIEGPDIPGTDQMYDGALALGHNIMRALCGPAWKPLEVTLARRRPPIPASYERFFGAPVRFDAERSAMSFPERWLDTPIRGADPVQRQMLQEQIDLLEKEEKGNLAEQVRRLIRASLLTSSISLGKVAELLKKNRRTLARNLETQGTSFKALSDEVHFDMARHLLTHTSLKITEVALALNYSESSAFTRAFRQWAGIPPQEWRVKNMGCER